MIYVFLCGIYEKKFCYADPGSFNLKYIYAVQLPVYILVATGYIFVRDDTKRFMVFLFVIIYRTMAYGIMGIIGIVLIFSMNMECFHSFYFNIFNFFMILIVGLNSTIIVTLLALIVACCLPCIIFAIPGILRDA